MPQLHFYTYLSQTTWTIIIFSLFYYFLKQYYLPSIFENLKVISLLLNKNSTESGFSSSTKSFSYDSLF